MRHLRTRGAALAVPLMIIASIMSALPSAAADPAADDDTAVTTSATALAHDGRTEATAAASCWEIKQNDPGSADGTYWLQTPAMDAPGQFFCDQTTDGGGWVMIGRGREGWQSYTQGWGDQSLLLTRDRSGANLDVAQLPAATVDGLLNNQPVASLDSGYRVVRAANAQGTKWQTIDIRPTQTQGWVWPFKTYTTYRARFDNGGWNYGTTMDEQLLPNCYWTACAKSIDVRSKSENGFKAGWAYSKFAFLRTGTFITQPKSGSQYLPFAEMYVRPQVTSDDPGFAAIADSGTAAIPSRTDNAASEYAQKTNWGVSGNLTGSVTEGSIQVQAFAQIGSTMFVGGNFTGVQRGSNGEVHDTTALAAFDANTGEWNGALTFSFDNQVHDLLALPDGRLLVAGDFTTVNGSAHAGTVVIDPATGAVDESWDLQIVNRLSSGTMTVKTLTTDGTYVYLGGAFTHLSGQGVQNSYGRAAARVDVSTGKPDRSWNPEFNGSVWGSSVDTDTGKYFAGGYFSKSGTTDVKWAASIFTAPGARVDDSFTFVSSVTGYTYTYTNPKKSYQQAVDVVDGNVYFGGSEHNLFRYDIATMNRQSGSITLANGGDIQAIESNNGVTYASCHCSDFAYQDAYSWDELTKEAWTEADPIRWVGAWDSATGEQLNWTPYNLSSTRSTGAWALKVTDSGILWAGGDFNNSYTSPTGQQWNGGFALYGPRDNTPTEAPGLLRVTGSDDDTVTLAWGAVPDATGYQVLLDDRTIATTTATSVTVPRAGNQRYFVRTVDGNGNISASSPVVVAPESGAADDSSPVLLEDDATWSYLSADTVPAENWTGADYDDSSWSSGAAPIGYGDAELNTAITPAPALSRPVTTYFRSSFTVGDVSAISGVSVSYVADDGAVVYVNGTEVSRTRLDDGAVTATTRANAVVKTAAARADRTVVTVPASALVDGENTIAVETHVNYRSSASMTMQAMVTRVDQADMAGEPAPDPAAEPADPGVEPAGGEAADPAEEPGAEPADPEAEPAGEATTPPEPVDPLQPVDATNATGEVIPAGSQWSYRYETTKAEDGWNDDADLGEWKTGAGPIGWDSRNSTINTPLERGLARTAYFSRDIDLGTVTDTTKLILKVRADDGAVVFVNGTEVGRLRMKSEDIDGDGRPDNVIQFTDSATQAISTVEASKDENMLTIELDSSVLRDGVNRIGVETHANYMATLSLTFDAEATLER
ncbi:Fibrinogen, alpha/beta/gamma chain, C-terminal globular domain [Propionibacterium ruminifibrarum]|uniref:Fibrinogen, alpha/beta/gamma chain, C-terminal globular domain n=2 Tax=Propionibacterium ruminifibrarum TaxID=1962131 RepID=A0A375I4E2_9ACTN|nr:Fibrinogen, alpha/beta/gamma chain, C-terminal globular domain [Propionibacterium ruminifibrarum]